MDIEKATSAQTILAPVDINIAHDEQARINAGPDTIAVGPATAPGIATWRLVSLYGSVCIGLFLSFLDTSIIATAIYTIGVEFHSLSKVNWIALSYTLAYAGCTAIFASLSDVIGRRNAYVAAFVIFLAFSLGCGFSQSLDQLIAMRALQGVGGSGLYSVGFVILTEITSPRALFPIRLAKNRVYISAVVTTMLTGFPYFFIIYSLPTRFQVVNGKNAIVSGIALLPMLGASAIGTTIAGAASSKRNNTFPVNVIGAALMLVGAASLSTLGNTVVPQVRAFGLQVFLGFGFGLIVSNSTLLATIEAEQRDTGVAQGIMAQVRVLGGSIGIAASTAILGVKQRRQLLDLMVVSVAQLGSLADSMRTLSPDAALAVRQTYTDAFNETLVVCSIVSGVDLLASLAAWRKQPTVMNIRK
ncbi:unnamed protein product [Alternaria sp. RS040]